MTNRNENRERAYHYVVELAKRMNWIPSVHSDERLADVLHIPISDIHSLKWGQSDPSLNLIKEVKGMIGPLVREDEIDSYLVTPFFP